MKRRIVFVYPGRAQKHTPARRFRQEMKAMQRRIVFVYPGRGVSHTPTKRFRQETKAASFVIIHFYTYAGYVPIHMYSPRSGAFGGRIRYAPTRVHEKSMPIRRTRFYLNKKPRFLRKQGFGASFFIMRTCITLVSVSERFGESRFYSVRIEKCSA